ncbi:MAG: hypothetical protein RR909_03420 [Bacilli bacterium]
MLKRKEDIVENNDLENAKTEFEKNILDDEVKVEEPVITAENSDANDIKNMQRVDEEGFAVNSEETTVDENAAEYVKVVDDARLHYLGLAKKMKYINYGILALILVSIVLVFIFLIGKGTKENNLNIIGTVVVVLLLAAVLGYNFFSKRFLNKKAIDYVQVYYKHIINTIFSDESFSDLENDPKGKIDPELFKSSRVFNGIKAVGSRNVTHVKHNGVPFMLFDASAEVQGPKRLEPVFLGKVLHFENALDFPGRILISVKGTSKYYIRPNDIEGLTVLAETDGYVIYSNYEKANKLITKSVLNEISKYKVNENLIDIFISVSKGNTFVGIDLSDKEMNIPVDTAFNAAAFENTKQYILQGISIIEKIEKNGTKKEENKE